MVQKFRNDEGGLIDRKRPLGFSFDGKDYQGYEGRPRVRRRLRSS